LKSGTKGLFSVQQNIFIEIFLWSEEHAWKTMQNHFY